MAVQLTARRSGLSRRRSGNSYRRRSLGATAAVGAAKGLGRLGVLGVSAAPRLGRVALGLGAVAAAGLFFLAVSLGMVSAYRHLTQHAYFELTHIEVVGNRRLAYVDVLAAAGVELGANSLALTMREVEEGLQANPWVERALVRRVLPDGFRITVFEKTPRYWLRQGGELLYADAAGRPIAPVQTRGFASLPLLVLEPGFIAPPALTAAQPDAGPAAVLSRVDALLQDAGLPFRVADASMARLGATGEIELQFDEHGVTLGLGAQDLQGNVARLARVYADVARRGELPVTAAIRAHGPRVWLTRTT